MINYIKRKIKGHFIRNNSLPDLRQALLRLNAQGYSPTVVFDVGAYKGTFSQIILDIWPEAEISCFEPQIEAYQILCQNFKNRRNVQCFNIALGNENGNVQFHLAETASSVLEEHVNHHFPVTDVPVHTISNLIHKKTIPVPSLLKIDTQGYEYQVLEGCEDYLEQVDVILAELNLIDIHTEIKLLHEVINYLSCKGFVAYDLTEIHRRPLDSALYQIDLIFVKKDSVFRRDKRWSI
jgi:FkbM family methyltransferase